MKKLLITVTILLITGCIKQTTGPGGGSLSNPLPLAVGNYWAFLNYSTGANSDTTRDTVRIVGTDVINGHNAFVTVWSDEPDTSYIYRDGDYIYIYSQDGGLNGFLMKFLKIPLNEGDSWTVYSESDSSWSFVITATVTGMVDVEVPAGRFNQSAEVRMMEVQTFRSNDTTYADTSYTYYYFAEDVGLVKVRDIHDNDEDISELEGYDVR